MDNTSTMSAVRLGLQPWVRRVRLILGIGLVLALLKFVVTCWAVPHGLHRPVTLVGAESPGVAIPLLVIVLWVGAAGGALLAGRTNPAGALLVTTVALAIWATLGGTMTDWLKDQNTHPGPPTGTPYWPLIADYLVLLLGMAGVIVVGAMLARRGPVAAALRLRQLRTELPAGLATFGIVTGVAAVCMWVLMGSAVANTHRGQVYFACVVGFFAGPIAARHLLGQRHPLWYWLAPFAAGLIGVIVAGLRPGLMIPAAYAQLDLPPAWWLVRPLPVEMVSVGLLGVIWSRATEGALGQWDAPHE